MKLLLIVQLHTYVCCIHCNGHGNNIKLDGIKILNFKNKIEIKYTNKLEIKEMVIESHQEIKINPKAFAIPTLIAITSAK